MTKLAYTYGEAAAEVGISERAIRGEVAAHRLVAHFYGAKPLIGHDDLQRWFDALPLEPHRRSGGAGSRSSR